MSAQNQVLYVQVGRVNLRRDPNVTPDNVIGLFYLGDSLEVKADVRQTDAQGRVWRQLPEGDQGWVAEFDPAVQKRLLDLNPPPMSVSAGPQVLYVRSDGIKLRSAPAVTPDNVVGLVKKGDPVQVQPDIRQVDSEGRVWRQVIGGQWVAEYNRRTGNRLLTPDNPAAASSRATETQAVPAEEPAQPAAGRTAAFVGGRVKASGVGFLLDGKPFRFIGVNLREFVFYGAGVIPAQAGNQIDQLNAARDMKARVVRMHACHRAVPLEATIPLMQKALDLLHQYNMLAIVCLNDALGDSSFYVPGDDHFHQYGHPMGYVDKVAYFHNEGYKQNQLPFVRQIVAAFKDHPAIFAWELGNEYALHPQPASDADAEAFIRYAQVVSQAIRQIDPNHLITTGLVNTGHIAPSGCDRIAFARRFYAMPTIDFATVHFYQDNSEEQSSLPDLEACKQIGKPLIVEEYGSTEGDRAAITAAAIERWLAMGAAGFMQWGLSATPFDVGVGDGMRGMDPYCDHNRNHYQGMFNVYRQWAERLEA